MSVRSWSPWPCKQRRRNNPSPRPRPTARLRASAGCPSPTPGPTCCGGSPVVGGLPRLDPRSYVLRRPLGAFVRVGVAGEPVVLRQACVLCKTGPTARAVALGREVAVDHARALATLVDRPNDQRLAA